MGTVSYLSKVIPQAPRGAIKRIVTLNARREPKLQPFTKDDDTQIGPIVFRCPVTGHSFESGIEMDLLTFQRIRHLSVHVRCPACAHRRELTVADGHLAF
jgi:hypothetical protein